VQISMTRDEYEGMRQEILTLKERVAFLESREVCAVAHENVETCGYCQRDNLMRAIAKHAPCTCYMPFDEKPGSHHSIYCLRRTPEE
jgi:hypothetical protein